MVRNVVENHIVTLPAFGEIFFGVINDVIRAERSNHIHISRTTYTGHIRAERFRDLHREGSHTSRRPVNQDFLAGLNFSLIAKSLQCRDARYVDRSRLLKSDVCRLDRDGSVRARTNVLGKGTASPAEHFITWFELSNILTDCFNRPGVVNAEPRVLWFSQPNSEPHDLGRAFDEMPVVRINGSRANSYQDLIVIRNRLFNVLKLKIG